MGRETHHVEEAAELAGGDFEEKFNKYETIEFGDRKSRV